MGTYLAMWIIFSVSIYIQQKKLISVKTRRGLVVLTGIIYIVFAVFRNVSWNPNLDIYHYELYFKKAYLPLFSYIKASTLEIGYTLLEWVIYRLFGDFRVLLFVVHMIVYISTMKLIEKFEIKNYLFVWIGLMAFGLFTPFYLVRHSIAISLSMLVYLELKKRKYCKAILLSLIAISIHNASFVLLFICVASYLFYGRVKISKYKLVFWCIVTVAAACIVTPLISLYFAADDKYFVYVGNGSVGYRFYATALITWVLAIINLHKAQDDIYQIATISLTCLFVLFPIQLSIGIVYRMTLFFQPLIYYLLLKILCFYKKSDIRYIGIRLLGYLTLSINLYQFLTRTVEYIGNPYIWKGI